MGASRAALAPSLLMLVLMLLPGAPSTAQSDSSAPIRVVLKGYDPVAYFTARKAVKGTPHLSYDWDEGRYLFSRPEHREMFATNPDRYAPQFAGLCAAGVAAGKRVEANPELWAIVNGRLYVFASLKAKESLEKDPEALLARAHGLWRGTGR